MIRNNLEQVREQIRLACKRAGREETSVTLLAVSKTKPVEMLVEAHECGATEFGENKVQEIVEKAERLGTEDYHFHMIGHLQKNKVKKAVLLSVMIHSVDSLELALCIDREAEKLSKRQDILLEVNVAEEDSKFGIKAEEVEPLVREIARLSHVRLRGFMTVAPYTDNPENNRKYFKEMHDLLVDINGKCIDNVHMDILSMGMSGDYTVAIEEGATHIRVGTGIFGERNYQTKEQK